MNDNIPDFQLSSDWPPFMPWRQFAEWVREEPGVVQGWIDRGYLPTARIGKRRVVNIVALIEQLREGE